MDKTSKSPSDSSAMARSGTLPEVMYSLNSLARLYELGLIVGTDMEPGELRQRILQHIQQAIQARGACLLLYHRAQHHFVPVANQGEKLPGGMLANMLDSQEIEQLSQQESIATLTTMHVQHQHILLVTLNYQQYLIGLIALTLTDTDTLHDERGLLLSYLGNIAAQVLYHYEQHNRERQQLIEQERARIARDLHDGVVQQIAYVIHKLELAQRLFERQQSQTALTEIMLASTILEECLQEMRDDIAFLHPFQLHNQSFEATLATLLTTFKTHYPDITVTQHLDALDEIPGQLEIPLFRLIQEGLTNIRKHAQATTVDIRLYSRAYRLNLEIHDNGIGLDQQRTQLTGHSGLHNMQERVREVGGHWHIQSQLGTGTTITASFPMITAMTVEITQREKEVLRLIVEGLSNREIAQKLAISPDTVKTHIHHIMQKLQVKHRIQAAIIASTQGWL